MKGQMSKPSSAVTNGSMSGSEKAVAVENTGSSLRIDEVQRMVNEQGRETKNLRSSNAAKEGAVGDLLPQDFAVFTRCMRGIRIGTDMATEMA